MQIKVMNPDVFQGMEKENLITNLTEILSDRLQQGRDDKPQTAIILYFALEYAAIMEQWNFDQNDYRIIVDNCGIPGTYAAEIAKMTRMYRSYCSNFFLNNAISSERLNLIVFGAPGTGKSYYINQKLDDFNNVKRVTFYSTYSYAQFVGSYKPVMNEQENISYEFVPGPFLEMLYDATTDPNGDKYLLVIEEINRAEAASVFGDMFQLLDRDSKGDSTYSIFASRDVRRWWNKKNANNLDANVKLRIPSNMYIWATMNSADQGVFPLDTAFKRRWSFEYMTLDNENAEIAKSEVKINDSTYRWDYIRKGINRYLKDKRINEDKMLGQFFLSENEIDNNFNDSFKYKVLMYLYEDAARAYRADLFGNNTFSEVLSNYDNSGLDCFNGKINVDPITIKDGNNHEDNN